MKIAFICDSGANKSVAKLKEKGIYSFPIQITFNQQSKKDIEEITHEEVYALMSDKQLVQTSLPSAGEMEDCFNYLKKEGYTHLFCVMITKGISSTMDTIKLIANQQGLECLFVDPYTAGPIQYYLLETAITLYNQGKDIYEIQKILCDYIEKPDNASTLIICDDLKYLNLGGRISNFTALLGGFLKIKPILHLDSRTSGRINVLSKTRTLQKAAIEMVNYAKELFNDNLHVVIAHVDNIELAKKIEDLLNNCFKSVSIETIDLPLPIAVHCGMKAIALQCYRKINV